LGDFVVDGCLVEVIGDVVGGVIEAWVLEVNEHNFAIPLPD
jgi:hypothetical protein